jgi:glycine cleavage system aminomethyltransferase T
VQKANPGDDVTCNYLGDSQQLLALQGDGAKDVMAALLPAGFQLEKMAFMTGPKPASGGRKLKNAPLTKTPPSR